MAAFYAFHKFRSINLKPAFLAGLLLFITLYILESSGISYNYLQIAYALSFGLLILGAVSYENSGFKAAKFKALSLIGDASYSIYLTHLAFLGLISKIVIKLSQYFPLNPVAIYFIAFGLTVISGCFLYLFVERPLLQYCRKLIANKRQNEPIGEAGLPSAK